MIRAYLPPLVISALICGGLTYYVKQLAVKFGLFDKPSPRKIHQKPTPRLGGVAIVLALLIVIFGYNFASHRLSFLDARFLFFDGKIFGLILGLIILLAAGVYDDIRGLSAFKKFFWQAVASAVVVGFGTSIGFLRLPLGLHVDLASWQIPINLYSLHLIFTVWGDLVALVWLLLIINTFNFLDGLDGLASGISIITTATIFLLSLALGQDSSALLAVLMAGAVLGFLPWNFNPAKIFLGDSGSMALGLSVGALAMISGGKLATAFLVLGIPVLDVGWVVLRRIFKKKSPFLADRRHLHHRLLTAGFNQRQAVVILYIISLSFGLIAVFSKTQAKVNATMVLLALMAALAIALVIVELRKKGEFKKDE